MADVVVSLSDIETDNEGNERNQPVAAERADSDNNGVFLTLSDLEAESEVETVTDIQNILRSSNTENTFVSPQRESDTAFVLRSQQR